MIGRPPASLTARALAPAPGDQEPSPERSSRVPMGRNSRRAMQKLVSHVEKCGSMHMPHFVALASRFADERSRELCLAL